MSSYAKEVTYDEPDSPAGAAPTGDDPEGLVDPTAGQGRWSRGYSMTGDAVHWRRYGKDRLYVTAADGVNLGHRDLQTQQDHVEAAGRAAEFNAIVAD